MKITIIGLGYVGLPLMLRCIEKGHEVYGVDTDQTKIDSLKKGVSPIKDIALNNLEKTRLTTNTGEAIKDSEIIILDESTSNLDYATENKIMLGIDKELKDKTLIISAHRLSTLRNVDKILVMEKGRIVEQGTYGELLKNKGRFYKLWREQKAWKDG